MEIIKNKLKLILLLTVIIFSFGVSEFKAQNFPSANAVWVFKSNNPVFMDELAQKWEYIGDSTVNNGIIKKMKVTTKNLNPNWYPNDTTTVILGYQYFLYIGDTIWNTNDSLSPMANFSLQVGDSTFTPYHSQMSTLYPSIIDSMSTCSEESKTLFFQKGVVIEAGTETENTINSRFYKLKFINEEGDTIIKKFSEKSIITDLYWYYNTTTFFECGLTDIPIFSLLCFEDSFSPNCNELDWFENLSVDSRDQLSNLEIFPNPANEIISLKTNKIGSFLLNIYDLNGILKITKNIYFDGKTVNTDVSELQSGTYFLEIMTNEIKSTKLFIKN